MKKCALFVIGVLLTISGCSWQQKASVPFAALTFVSSPFTFELPPEMLDGARVVSPGGTGLAIVQRDSYISIDTVTGDAIGYPNLDMRSYPTIIWGNGNPHDQPPGLLEEMASIRRLYAVSHPHMEKPIALNQGTAWFAHGSEETVTLLTHKDHPYVLVRLYTRNVPADVVREKIIGSVSEITRR